MHNIKKKLTCFLSLIVVFTVICTVNVYAEKKERKTVKVGYVYAPTYEEGGDEYKRGSGYEYLQRISYLTGWKYEYVYGSFKECYDKLVKGEIDLFGNVSYTPERAELISYSSYPQGKDVYILYTSKNREDLANGDIKKLNGCKIGVTAGSYQKGLLENWLIEQGISAKVMEYQGYDPLMSNLDDGNLDAIVTPDLASAYDYLPIINIGFSDYFFAVSKSRPDLLTELNEALYEIQNSEVDYNNLLVSRYQNQMLTGFNASEKEWLKEHDNTIRLGYILDNLPFCGEEKGELAGVLKLLVDALEEEYNIKIETIGFSKREQMTDALASGEIDVLGPVYSDYFLAERHDYVLTNAIMTTTPLIIYKGDNVERSMDVIAATDLNIYGKEVLEILYPEAEIRLYENQEKCLKAVADGKAGCTIVSSSRLNILRSNPIMDDLSFAEMTKKTEISLVAAKDNGRVATIMNKGIIMSSDLMNGVVLAQHSVTDNKTTLWMVIKENLVFLLFIISIIILTLAILIIRLSVSHKRLAEALEEAQSGNMAKTIFLNNMSHDIRTPMNAIIGFKNIALRSEPKPEVRECLEKIGESSEHLLTLINDVLDISRIESGKMEYNPVPVEISTLTDVVLDVIKGLLTDRNINLFVHRKRMENQYVLTDPIRIREVLVNVLSNAVKFTNDGGSITFDTDYFPGREKNWTIVRFKVSDTGVGMSQEFLEHIFDEFAQEEFGARTKYKGTGLGMSIVKKYVEMMDGSIKIESEKGVGTTVTIDIPMEHSSVEKEERHVVDMSTTDLTGVKVLLVEDNDLNAEIAMMQLEDIGMAVTRVGDGKQAVNAFADNPPGTFDLILMDIMMPVMNGYEATTMIRSMSEREDAAEIPIVAMTANAFAADVQASMDAGMNAHIAKPIIIEEMVNTIARVLSDVKNRRVFEAFTSDHKGTEIQLPIE